MNGNSFFVETADKNTWKRILFNILVYTDGTLIRAEEGPKVLASPPTAYMAQAIYLVAMADYTLGGYNWRHRGDF